MGRSSAIVCFAALIALLIGLAWWTTDPMVHVPANAPGTAADERAAVAAEASIAPRAIESTAPQRQEVSAARPAEGPGSLVVRARHVRGDLPAVGMNFRLLRPGLEPVVLARARADASGVATFANVPSGPFLLHNDRRDRERSGTIVARRTIEIDFAVQVGLRIAGVVVDDQDRPVAGAHVMLWMNDDPSEQNLVAVADATGAFTVLDAFLNSGVGACAPGFVASAPLRLNSLRADGPHRLVLGSHGLEAAGFVVDAMGAPIADAFVEIGDVPGTASWPAIARTDRFGRFRVFGLAAGSAPLRAHARWREPQHTTIEVAADLPLQRIVLQHAGSLSGIVRDANGRPVRGARVKVVWPEGGSVLTAKDGAYELAGVPVGDLRVEALGHGPQYRTEVRVTTVAGQRLTLDLQLPAAGPAIPSSR